MQKKLKQFRSLQYSPPSCTLCHLITMTMFSQEHRHHCSKWRQMLFHVLYHVLCVFVFKSYASQVYYLWGFVKECNTCKWEGYLYVSWQLECPCLWEMKCNIYSTSEFRSPTDLTATNQWRCWAVKELTWYCARIRTVSTSGLWSTSW
jgi:hypothetical protein